ncbi:primosomal protein N' family DNA-binding protein, partial [Staphylococcus aureus]
LDMSKLKSIIEVKDIKPELTPELIALSEWMSTTHVIKRISMLEVMLPSAIKAKYKKAFMLKDDTEVTADILKRFDKNGFYYYKDAQKNNDIASLMSLLQAGIIEEKTILSQNVTKKTKRAVRIIDGFNPDEVLA